MRLLAVLILVLTVGCSSGGSHQASPGTAAPTSAAPPPTWATTTAAPTAPAITSARSTTSVAPTAPAICGSVPAPPARYEHVIWIWMENHRWSQVLGAATAAPYETMLARRCASATNYAAVASPSLPNYLGATSGGTHGVADDASPPAHPLAVDNLFRQVRDGGGTERSYEEAMAAPCQLASAGRYAVKHNPAAYYVGPGDRAACLADDLPYTAFQADLQADRLPTFAFVTPDLCHDTHDCPVSTGDAWLAANVAPILASRSYRSGTTAVLVVWDEPTPMPFLVIAPSVRPGTVVSQPFDHYSLLATTEEMLALARRLGAAAGATSVRNPFNL
jgi:hypothetical protein